MSNLKREWNARRDVSNTCFQLWCLFAFTVFAKCEESYKCADIYPKSEVYVILGEPVELICVTKPGFASDHLEFTWRGQRLDGQTKVNDTAIKLVIKPNPERGKYRVTYHCKSKNEKCEGQASKLIYASQPPKKIEDFQCISTNLETLNCSWISPDDLNTDYTVKYIDYRGGQNAIRADAVPPTKRKYCVWNGTFTYRYDEKNFTLYINATNKLGTSLEIKNIPDHFAILKPAPVMNLSVVNVSTRHVELQWYIRDNLVLTYYGEFEHKIVCDLIRKRDSSEHIKTLYHYSNHTNAVIFNLTDLYAHMQYRLKVYMKPDRASKQFWSEPSEIYINTSSEVPMKPPDVVPGSFYQVQFVTGRQIYIYWKQLEENEEAGSNFCYRIYTDAVKGPEIKTTEGFLRIDNAPNKNFEISIWAENEIGKSINASFLYIPYGNTPQVSSLTKRTYNNDTNKLSWTRLDNVDNYTIFWCPYHIKNHCNERINYTVVGAHEKHFFITLPRDTLHPYQFAISANYRGATHGMTWTTCTTTHDGHPSSDFNVKFKGRALTKTSVEMDWSHNCILEEDYLRRYIIGYCPKGIPSSDCKDHYKYTYNTEQLTFIHGLKPYTAYVFTIKLDTVHGIKSVNETIDIITLPDTPTIPRNVNISAILNNSLVIIFDPPDPLNGDKTDIKYYIFNGTKELASSFSTTITVSNLLSFTNYSLSIRACNVKVNDSCSNSTDSIFVRTRVGSPGRVSTPIYEIIEGNKFRFKWKEPKIRGGNIDLYQIKIIKDSDEEVFNVENRYYAEFEPCDTGVQNVGFRVRAVNNDSDAQRWDLAAIDNEETFSLYYGEWSEERPVPCQTPMDLTVIYYIALGLGTLLLGYLVRHYHLIIQAKKDIYPVFAQGLLPQNVIPPTTVNENRTILDKLWLLLCKRSQIRVNQFNQQASVESSKPLISHEDALKNHVIAKGALTMYTTELLSSNANTEATIPCEDVEASIETQQPPDSNTKPDVRSSKRRKKKNTTKTRYNAKGKETAGTEITNQDSLLKNKLAVPKPKVNPKSGYVQSSVIKPSIHLKPVVNTQTGYVQTAIAPKVNASDVSSASKHTKGYVKASPISLKEINKPNLNLASSSVQTPSKDVLKDAPAVSSYVRIGVPENNSKIPPKNETDIKQNTGYLRPEPMTKQEKIFKPMGPHNKSRIPSEDDWPSERIEMKVQSITDEVRDKQIDNKPITSKSGYVKPEDVINKQLNILSRGNDAQATSQEGYCRLSLDRFNNKDWSCTDT